MKPKITAIELIIYLVFLSFSDVIIIIGIDSIKEINDPSIHQTIPGRSIKQMIIEIVITSYSIHYTKLYEKEINKI